MIRNIIDIITMTFPLKLSACPGIRKKGGPKPESLFFFLLINFSGGGAQLRKWMRKLYFRLKK